MPVEAVAFQTVDEGAVATDVQLSRECLSHKLASAAGDAEVPGSLPCSRCLSNYNRHAAYEMNAVAPVADHVVELAGELK